MIKLGSSVVDVISGFKGIATARTEYLFGCVVTEVSATDLGEDGKPVSKFIDEASLAVLDDEALTLSNLRMQRTATAVEAGTGGPERPAAERTHPTR